MNKSKFKKNPYLLFLPFLIFLTLFALLNQTEGFGDEGRYLMFANNLLHGFYSPPPPHVSLDNAPGYPLVIAPIVALGLKKIYVILLNPIIYYLSIVFLYKAMSRILPYKTTLFFSLLWAGYYIAYQNVILVAPEPLNYLFMSLLIYSLVNTFYPANAKQEKKHLILAGFFLGYIVLIRIAFIYVLFTVLLGSLILWLFNKRNSGYKKLSIISTIAFVTVLPYLIYAFFLTGRMFYWNTNTGDALYWASSPYSNEYGDWRGFSLETAYPEFSGFDIPGTGDVLKAHHGKEFDEILKFSGYQRDSAFRAAAIRNIKNNPLKYLQNCFYNAGRLIFHYPFSMAIQRPKVLLVFPMNGIIFTFILLSAIPTIINWRKIMLPMKFLLFIFLLYFGESILVSGLVRMFTVIVPILIFWFAYISAKTVSLKLNW